MKTAIRIWSLSKCIYFMFDCSLPFCIYKYLSKMIVRIYGQKDLIDSSVIDTMGFIQSGRAMLNWFAVPHAFNHIFHFECILWALLESLRFVCNACSVWVLGEFLPSIYWFRRSIYLMCIKAAAAAAAYTSCLRILMSSSIECSTVVAVVVAVINFVTKTGLIQCDTNGCECYFVTASTAACEPAAAASSSTF